ncbi:hypothetical protein NDU88_004546 [Pleurodeles waltl]|uniref:Uncharacterized protein n=1 Tax=Pleurodeles waltl TaxID=8319 RepID=A0AAV7SJ81_PLEWA|nr:hypothetical protein NDU88_004546 [Pleurodeles waltl]
MGTGTRSVSNGDPTLPITQEVAEMVTGSRHYCGSEHGVLWAPAEERTACLCPTGTKGSELVHTLHLTPCDLSSLPNAAFTTCCDERRERSPCS